MSFYREVNTGQVVEITDPPFYLDGLARWERTPEDPRDPQELADLAAWLDAEAAHEAEPDADADADDVLAALLTQDGTDEAAVADAVETHDEAVGNTDPSPEVPAPADTSGAPAMPAGNDRDEWIAYAISQGHPDDFAGVRTREIAAMYRD